MTFGNHRHEIVNTHNPVIKLCIEGTQAEFKGHHEEAQILYWKAWENAQNDYEACIAAHYVAQFQQKPEDILFWNLEALNRADHVQRELVKDFYPSLYLNMGRAYEIVGNASEAQKYYDLAAKLGFKHLKD